MYMHECKLLSHSVLCLQVFLRTKSYFVFFTCYNMQQTEQIKTQN